MADLVSYEPPAFVSRGRVSVRASTAFTYFAETIARAYEPTPTQLSNLQRAYESTGEYLVGCPDFGGLLTQVHAHGSRQLGTIVRPSPSREGWDIDLVVRLGRAALQRYGGDQGPALLLRHLSGALERYALRHQLSIERWERCVTLVYAEGMRADFAAVIDDPLYFLPHGESHGRIPDRELRRYLSTNPRGYCGAFDDAARIAPNFPRIEELSKSFTEARRADVLPLPNVGEVFGRLLSRLVQIAKVHRNVAFAGPHNTNTDLRPSSVFVTTLLAAAYVQQAPRPHDGPLDLLIDMVDMMPLLFGRHMEAEGTERWELPNPTAQNDNLAASMNERHKQKAFVAWHGRLKQDLFELLNAIEHQSGLDTFLKTVRLAFGETAALAIGEDNKIRREANRSAGRSVFLAAGATPITSAARSHTNFGG